MNPVETPMMQMMQAFGATSPQSVAAMFGIQDATGDLQENYAALFSGYLQSVEGSKPTGATAEVLNASKNSVHPFSAAPEDFALAVNPVEQALRPINLQGLLGGEEVLGHLNQQAIEEGALTPERLAAFALAVDYKAAQPVALTPENLQALQTALTEVQKTANNVLSTQPIQIQSPQTVQQATGQFLPANELMYLFGQETELPVTLRGDAPGILFEGGEITRQPVAAAAAQANTVTGDLQNAPLAPNSQTPVQPPVDANGEATSKHQVADPAKATDILKTPEASTASVAAKEVSKIASTQKVLPDVILEDGDADIEGQVLTVAQKQQKTSNAALQNTGTQSQTSSGAETAPASAAAVSNAPRPQPTADKAKSDAPKVDSTAQQTASGSSAQANQQPVVQAPARPVVDWTSPWTTPERAAGWADGTAAGLISSGLGSLNGQNTPMAGLGLMGGRPDPLLGKQVAKQVNLNITRSLKAGDNQFAMRMDPPELGRVAVKMTFLANGLVKAQVMAERPETLEMLQREVKGLERAVESGGHKSEPGGISFSLDSGNGESAGKAFAEAMQEDKLNEEKAKASAMAGDAEDMMDGIEEEIDLEEILAHVTSETGIDVRV